MARFIGFRTGSSEGTPSTSISIARPPCLTGDLLIFSCAVVNSSPPTISTPAGWTIERTDINAQVRGYIFYKEAASDNEAFPTLTISSSTNWVATTSVVRGVDFSGGPFGDIGVIDSGNGADPTGPAITTTQDRSIVLNILYRERRAITGAIVSTPREIYLSSLSTGTGGSVSSVDVNVAVVKDFIPEDATAAGSTSWLSATGNGEYVAYSIEILTDGTNTPTNFDDFPVESVSTTGAAFSTNEWRDAVAESGINFITGAAQTEYTFDAVSDVDTAADEITIVGHGILNARIVRADANGGTLPTGLTDGYYYYVNDFSTDTIKLRFANDLHEDTSYWYNNLTDLDITSTGSGTCKLIDVGIVWSGYTYSTGSFSRPPNSSNAYVNNYYGSGVVFDSPVDFTGESIGLTITTASSAEPISAVVIVYDDSNNFKVWEVHQFGDFIAEHLVLINPLNDNVLSESGTLDITSIKRIGYAFIQLAGNQRANAVFLSPNIERVKTVKILGGDAVYKVSWQDVYDELNLFNIYTSANPSDIQYVFRQPIQFGAGNLTTDGDISFSGNEKSVAFPPKSDGVNSRVNYIDAFGIRFDLNENSDVALQNNSIGASSAFPFAVDPDRPAAASISLSGTILISSTPVFQSDDDIRGLLVIGGEGVIHNDATLTNCSFQNISRADGYLVLTPTHNLVSPEFITETASDYAIEIDTAGTYDISGFEFTGFTNDINITASSGTVTIQLEGGQDTPTYVTAGATVVIAAALTTYTVQFPNIVDGSRFQIYNLTQDTELSNGVTSGGTGINQEYTSGVEYDASDIGRYRITYQSGTTCKIAIEGTFTFSAITAVNSIPITQVDDAIFNSYGVDGSAITEFTWDSGNIEVDINDADNTTVVQRVAAWMCYYITTATGIDEAFGSLSWESLNSIKINTSVVDLKLDNTKATPLFLNGGRLYRDDNTTIITSTSNAIQIDYAPVYIAETGVSGLTASESTQLFAIGTPGAVADAVWDEPLSGHLTAGTTGEALDGAGGGGSAPTEAEIYTYFTSLNREDSFKADVSGLASQTSVDTIDGIVDAILGDTNELQTNQSNWNTATGFSTPTNVTDARDAIQLDIASLETKTQADARQVILVAEHNATQSAIAALNNLSAAQVNAEVDTALTDYDGPTKAELDSAETAILAAISGLNNESASSVALAVWNYLQSETTISASMKDAVEIALKNSKLIPAAL